MNLGIERYGIFCYDENVNTIIPLPCEYDTASSSIILDAEYMGDLFLLDYESLMYDLGVSPEIESIESDSSEIVDTDEPLMLYSTPTSLELENFYAGTELDAYEEVTVDEIESVIEDGAIIEKENLVLYSATTPKLLAAANTEIANSNSNTSSTARQVDLTLVIDTTGSMGSSIDVVKANLVDLINRLRQENISLYIAIVDYRDITCDGKNSTKLYDFSNLIDDIQANVNNLYPDLESNEKEAKSETQLSEFKIKMNLDYFESIKLLGMGSFGKVLLVRLISKNKYYAMKVLNKKMLRLTK